MLRTLRLNNAKFSMWNTGIKKFGDLVALFLCFISLNLLMLFRTKIAETFKPMYYKRNFDIIVLTYLLTFCFKLPLKCLTVNSFKEIVYMILICTFHDSIIVCVRVCACVFYINYNVISNTDCRLEVYWKCYQGNSSKICHKVARMKQN